MTADTQVRDPRTDSIVDVRSVINGTVDSARLDVLEALEALDAPVATTDVARRAGLTRQAASTHLSALEARGFLDRREEGVAVTAGGVLLRSVVDECLQTVSVDALAELTRSTHAVALLGALEAGPARPSDLGARVAGAPSRATVGRLLRSFADEGWVEAAGGRRRLAPAGTDALAAYRDLERSVAQLVAKSPWLLRLPVEAATVPVGALEDADMIVSDPARPSLVQWSALKLCDWNVSRFRTLCSIYNPVLFQAYRALLELGVEAEAILDRPTYREAGANRYTRFVVRPDGYDNYDLRVLDRPHTLGIGIYDDRTVAVGAYNEAGRGNHVAMIVSSNERLLEWGIDLYERHREAARDPSEVRLERATAGRE